MTSEDQKMLKSIREDAVRLAEKMGEASRRGYTINLNVDPDKGEVTSFVVKSVLDIDSTLN
jgi:hypothetical protein